MHDRQGPAPDEKASGYVADLRNQIYVRATLPKAAMMIPITISTNHPILLREITKRLLEQSSSSTASSL
jgi:hypothetical protein